MVDDGASGHSSNEADAAVERRKGEHMRLAATADVNTHASAGWEDVRLIHEAIPATDFEAVDTSVTFLGRTLRAPLFIAGMTGGHPEAEAVNACLARAAERYGLAMGVGSQRAAIRRSDLASTYRVARDLAPRAFLVANIGAPQLVRQGQTPALTVAEIRGAVEEIRADALVVHLNYLQEVVQPEGERNAAGVLDAIRRLTHEVGVPVIAKETGAGISRESAARLVDVGVAALDVGGVGGTSFAAVEGLRAAQQGDARAQRLGDVLRDWGIPTAVSVVAAVPAGVPVIATGGVRSGLDAAKAMALGATLAGVARPLLTAALHGGEAAVAEWVEQFLAELRAVLFLSGCQATGDLRSRPRVVLGETREWLVQLGLGGAGSEPASG